MPQALRRDEAYKHTTNPNLLYTNQQLYRTAECSQENIASENEAVKLSYIIT